MFWLALVERLGLVATGTVAALQAEANQVVAMLAASRKTASVQPG